MAYFLPSYFQKRLLRYALTRLDLIETEALDLENLDISLGQTSVVELKNVGIKVDKLIEKLQLPSTIALKRALIRKLRITVPADLHVSGIHVGVDGVDIHVEVQEHTPKRKTQSRVGLGRGDAAGRTDVSSQAQRHQAGRDDGSGSSHVIPTSQDLAKSFLEAEPREERAELEAALQSQSNYMADSTSSLEETGIGLPGGFSLPGFVANFFAGVADRLTVAIRNVEVTAGLQLPLDGSPMDTVKVMFRLAEISLPGLTNPQQESHLSKDKRRIDFVGFETLLLSEAEAFTQHSTATSPRLSRSRSKFSSTTGSGDVSRFESPESTFSPPQRQRTDDIHSELNLDSDGPGSPNSAPRNTPLHRSDDQFLNDSRIFDLSSSARSGSTSHSSLEESRRSFVDNRQHAERMLATDEDESILQSTTSGTSPYQEDLTQSKMFTHDEAESMYMSAVSTNPGMPGGWDTDDKIEEESSDQSPRAFTPTQTARSVSTPVQDESKASLSSSEKSDVSSREPYDEDNDDADARFTASYPELVAKRLISIDRLSLAIPVSVPAEELQTARVEKSRPVSTGQAGAATSLLRHGQIDSQIRARPGDGLDASILSHSRLGSRDFMVGSDFQYEIEFGDVSCHLDMSICRILVTAASAAKRMLAPTAEETPATISSMKEVSCQLRIGALSINACQSVPQAVLRSTAGLNTEHLYASACLLRLSLRNIQHEIALHQGESRQKLTVEKIEIGQAAEKFLYFLDNMNVRDSIATSVMIRPHDLVVTNLNDRYEVQLKPVHIVTDLLRVDDVLSRGGGLDSLLDLGNSVISAGTVKEQSGQAGAGLSRQRTVRFDNPSKTQLSDDEGAAAGPKIDIRISGVFVELIGSEATVQLRTTAVKTNLRQNLIRVQIEHAALAGPLLHGSRSSADINVKLSGISLMYLNTPKEDDLDRLLSLLTPSSDKYDDEDDIMVDTLIRQRRKGGVLRFSTEDVQINIRGISWHKHVAKIADELSKLSAVSKYLPEDDRPGVLLFAMVNKITVKVDLGRPFGMLHLNATLLEAAQVSVPSLIAAQISTLSVRRGDSDILLGEVTSQSSVIMGTPMLMCRFIADEMDPTVRVKLSNIQLEYRVSTVVAVTELLQAMPKDGPLKDEASSPPSSQYSLDSTDTSELTRKIKFSLAIRNSALALNPDRNPAKGLLVLSDALLTYGSKQQKSTVHAEIRKASILIVNNAETLGQEAENADQKLYFEENDQIQKLTKIGFVPVGSISNASANVAINQDKTSDVPMIDVEFGNKLFLLETCADSTQTLIQILSGLAPPTAPSPIAKYRTEIVPISDMLASFTGNAFVSEPGPELGLQASRAMTTASTVDDEGEALESEDEYEDEEYANDLYGEDDDYNGEMGQSYEESETSHSTMTGSIHVAPVNISADSQMGESIMAHSMLDFRSDHFVQKSSVEGTAHRWDSSRNTYEMGSDLSLTRSPLKVRVRDVHIIWNLFDGYDWQTTRDTISQAVQEIEVRASTKQSRRDNKRSPGMEDDESVIGDFLFNSIYIGIPANKDVKELTKAINQDIDDLASETGSYATGTTVTVTPSNRAGVVRPRKKLRLSRSRQHKMTFELQGVSADIIAFPPESGEVESSIDVRVKVLEIFDNVPTSTWKKFATYMNEAGEKEVDTSMVHLELLNVKPVAELAASEMVMKLTVLPLRLHVDQDALDFMTRFFEFKDDSQTSHESSSPPPFLQRVEVNPIRLKLDFKPKRVDYAGLRSGRTTEFMNFFVLDRADMVLRRVILYGVSGFDRLGIMLNNIWSPDVKRNQLPGVLAGLAPIRPFVDVTSGVRDLIAVPIREYKKDGRIVRSIQKGALAFAKTTTTELVNLGAKLAIGTQTVLQNAEEMLVPREQDEDVEPKEQISLYADQPLGIVQGLRGAYASLERDLLLAKDAIVAVPGEVMASGSARGAAAAVLKQSPTIILRPAMGVSKAVGQTLLGAGNTLDRGNIKRIEQKYKRH